MNLFITISVISLLKLKIEIDMIDRQNIYPNIKKTVTDTQLDLESNIRVERNGKYYLWLLRTRFVITDPSRKDELIIEALQNFVEKAYRLNIFAEIDPEDGKFSSLDQIQISEKERLKENRSYQY